MMFDYVYEDTGVQGQTTTSAKSTLVDRPSTMIKPNKRRHRSLSDADGGLRLSGSILTLALFGLLAQLRLAWHGGLTTRPAAAKGKKKIKHLLRLRMRPGRMPCPSLHAICDKLLRRVAKITSRSASSIGPTRRPQEAHQVPEKEVRTTSGKSSSRPHGHGPGRSVARQRASRCPHRPSDRCTDEEIRQIERQMQVRPASHTAPLHAPSSQEQLPWNLFSK